MPPSERRYRYHYYNVEIPEDMSERPEERGDLAINVAREGARLWIVPAAWWVVRDDGRTVRVCRKSHNRKESHG